VGGLRHVHVGAHPLGAAFVFPFPDGHFRSTFEFEAAHLDTLRTQDPLATHLGLVREALPQLFEEIGGDAIEPLTPLQMHPGHTTLLAGIVEDGVALVGDAAGCIDPFTGFGMSIGLADAELLAQTVAAAGGDYSARALREYERRRQPRIAVRREATDQLAYLFLNRSEPFAAAYAERIAQRWQSSALLKPMIALQFAGYDLPLVPSVGLKHHFFGLL
jgi:2-polyprenyl-6-methoxyphenol hydroxylase-like FAD-dependent oxidoreductase